jgi:carbon storage regulator
MIMGVIYWTKTALINHPINAVGDYDRAESNNMEVDEMLVLTRRPGESIVIGDGITITFLGARGRQIRIGVEAARELVILRAELKKPAAESVSLSPRGDGG